MSTIKTQYHTSITLYTRPTMADHCELLSNRNEYKFSDDIYDRFAP